MMMMTRRISRPSAPRLGPAGRAPRARPRGAPRGEAAAAAAATFGGDHSAAEAEDVLFFGPAPPEAEAEASLVGAAGRTAAVAEALRTSRSGGDAFDVLGVAPDASAAAIRKAFWRLSLLVHPDKCDHPDAPLAFDVVKKASEALGDAEARAALEAKRAEAANREGFDAWLAEERRKAEWRLKRGAPEPGDEALLRGGGADHEGGREGGREAWMTELPEQRRPSPHAPGPGGGTARAFREDRVRRARREDGGGVDGRAEGRGDARGAALPSRAGGALREDRGT